MQKILDMQEHGIKRYRLIGEVSPYVCDKCRCSVFRESGKDYFCNACDTEIIIKND